ncbi:glycosyltransferase family 4 protein [Vibrio cholerae]|nr:glycosyltransferase family 4 protein [Vibrio cholerae]EJL6268074.1 glycosyltransferase family 4 protein [Vibrio cholerae]EJX9125220.1 glycosyltransferase family 4 protein [Vibrio cholerae]EJY0788427.1 glycosyltransferase family 4 protein [Vibrio cholerae]EKF9882208.1 glycosyltransferase family 4 protein [Vibrio cholerae]
MSNIFINALSAKLGGGKTYIFNLLDNLPTGDFNIYVACPDIKIIPSDSRVIFVKSNMANKNILSRMLWEAFYLPFLLLRLKASVLFVPGGMDFTFFTFFIPKVTMFRNMLPFDKVAIKHLPSMRLKYKNWLLKYLMTRTMSSANHVIFISSYAKKVIEDEIKIKSASIIYHGISNIFTPISQHREEQEYLLYVSRFEPYKNHLNLIVAYSKLDAKYKKKYKLLLVGEFMEPSYSECVNYVKNNDLSELVIFKGKVSYENLPEIYQSASLFIFPSSCENCPNILLEAIGCGVPVIASKTEPMPEFAQYAGLYFDEKNNEEIFSCLNNVLSEPKLLSVMKERSVSLRDNYMWKNTAMKTWKCLKEFGDINV